MITLDKEYYKEERRLLRKAKEEGKLVVFVGAGASIPSGMPMWRDAVEKFKECLHMGEHERQDDYLKIPQLYYNARGEKEYVELARHIFRHDDALEPSDIHRRIIDLNAHTIITTNYDTLIEKAASEKGEFMQIISQNQDLPYKTAQKEVLKMHGDFEHNNFVLKEDDYLNYSENFKLIETYVKSLIASNVVLFIGYSFSDPDLKQLFNWVKNILGNDFQRAYMIEAYHEYNRNDHQYYKNLGVNVLYASQAVKDSFQKEHASQYVVAMLDYILEDKKTENAIHEIYDYLRPFCGMNYTLQRYLSQCFGKYGIVVENHVMWAFDRSSSGKDSVKIIHELMSEEKGEKVKAIREVLGKSSVHYIEDSQKQETGTDLIGYSMESKDLSQRFIAMYQFDEAALRKQKEKKDMILSEEIPELYLEQAYICYWLEEYINAYKFLKQAAAASYSRKLYQWYFIAELNRHFLGKIILSPNVRVENEIKAVVKSEIEKIQLEKIFSKVPNIGNDGNQFLKELYTFQVNYLVFQEIFKSSRKVMEEATTKYFIHSDIPEYEKMRIKIEDYFFYLEENYLMLDQYVECREIFQLYLESYLSSVGSSDMVSKGDNVFSEYSSNIRADKLGKFEIFLILRYWNVKELTAVMQKYSIEHLEIEDGCEEYLKKVFGNLLLQTNKKVFSENKVFVFLVFVTKLDLDSEFIEEIIFGISQLINEFDISTQKTVILNFIINNFNHKKLLGQAKELSEQQRPALESLLERILTSLSNTGNETRYIVLIRDIVNIVRQVYGTCRKASVMPVLKKGECVRTLALIYPICDEQAKGQIRERLETYMKNAGKESFLLYHDMVMNEIIMPTKEYEKNIWDALPEIKEESRHHSPNMYTILLNDMMNLYLNKKIILKDRYQEACRQSEDACIRFLSDMEHFDYKEFELEWLLGFSPGLRETIAANATAGPKIRRQFKEYFMRENDDKKLLKIYFENFA
ncbi:MAG: hypothetical protein HDR01_07515 [Lachnospiraceae bacterium]|nr:hypothetical protein [Lachnospiraceae bacterium]